MRAVPSDSLTCSIMSSTTAWYRVACSRVSGASTRMCSLSGRSATTLGSDLRRRSTNGAARARSREAAASSRCDSMGTANRARNVLADPSRPGLAKSSTARSSSSRFSTGVPVRAIRCSAGIETIARATEVEGFLMVWASSATSRRHGAAARSSASREAVPYDVRTRSAAPSRPAASSPRSREGPWWTRTVSSGAKVAASRAQVATRVRGATTRVGPSTPRACSEAVRARTCMVLPSPMSSARTAPTSARASAVSQRTPSSW